MTEIKPGTPLPWLQGTGGGGGATNYVYEAIDGQQHTAVASCFIDTPSRPFAVREANAAYIVTACNAYPSLITGLREAREALAGMLTGLGPDGYAIPCGSVHTATARATLAHLDSLLAGDKS